MTKWLVLAGCAYMHDVGESPLWLTKVRPVLADIARAFKTDGIAPSDENHRECSVRIDFDSFDD